MSNIKKCSKCLCDKELSSFSPAKKYRDGLRNWCRSCYSEYQKDYAKRYEKEKVEEKRCSRCKSIKPIEEFVKNRLSRGGRLSLCKPCHSQQEKINKKLR